MLLYVVIVYVGKDG